MRGSAAFLPAGRPSPVAGPRPVAGPAASAADPAAAVLLVLLILSITLGPRIRVGVIDDGRAIDLRLQDLLLPVAAMYALVSPGGLARSALRRVWGSWGLAFAFVALGVTLLHILFDAEVSAVKRVSFLARALELCLLAIVVARLCQRGGEPAARWAFRFLHVAVVANVAWFAYQMFTGDTGTLLGGTVGDQIESYGPKLVGEASSFGSGSFFALTAALAIADYRARLTSRVVALVIFTAALAGAFLAESRISLGAIGALALLFLLQAGPVRSSRFVRMAFVAGLGVAVTVSIVQDANARFSRGGVENSLHGRLTDIWPPLWHLGEDPLVLLLGIGPGGLATPSLPITEAHNILLRAWLDLGLVGGLVFVAMLATAFWRAHRAARRPASTRLGSFYADLAALSGVWILVEGTVQDSMTAVTSSHLAMLAIGLFAGTASEPGPEQPPR